jgi:hypothetical protein
MNSSNTHRAEHDMYAATRREKTIERASRVPGCWNYNCVGQLWILQMHCCQLGEWILWKFCIGMIKSMDLTVGDALYLYTICLILSDSSDFLLYKESLFLWLCIEPPRHDGPVQQSNNYGSYGSLDPSAETRASAGRQRSYWNKGIWGSNAHLWVSNLNNSIHSTKAAVKSNLTDLQPPKQ